ncbi:gamma-glutamyltranspeptidase [Achlya hypogyna]|uniref:Gamma-glutamyltranspeptidase n=1 Tax=Achlya hypogyna TaxID=1202772 RepID=A0A1V9YWA0_ACHHY|nr:gamma-glutamyltranspeptidase [Achlya hypogyna]
MTAHRYATHPRSFTRSPVRRLVLGPIVYGTHGMVATNQPLASEIGYRILRQGGNAVDAAIAIAAALNVTEPCSTGIGGDCFLLYYNAETRQVAGLNGSGRCPKELTLERAKQDLPNETSIPLGHVHSITVPGTVAGWVDAVKAWGTMSMQDILQPAIDLAREGFPVAPVTAYLWDKAAFQLTRWPHPEDLLIDGRAPRTGEIFKNPNLAASLEAIGLLGKAGFYEGPIAQAIVDAVAAQGGLLSLEDLKSHTSTFVTPIKTTFDGVDVYEIPPNGQGITALLALNLLAQLDGDALKEHNSVDYLHALIETMRVAFADARWYVSDPAFETIPIDELLSAAYAKERAKLVNPDKAMVDPVRGSPVLSSDTVSFQVVDADGNAVSMVNSNYAKFGSGLIPFETGFSLQNRGSNFVLEADHPNALAPGKRPYHTIIPAMSLFAESHLLHSTFSVMGGFMQPQGHVQVMLNMIRFGFDPQEALDASRFCIGAAEGENGSVVSVEDTLPAAVIDGLRAKGHNIRVVANMARELFGRGQIIARDPATGVLIAGSDGRGDGVPMGW